MSRSIAPLAAIITALAVAAPADAAPRIHERVVSTASTDGFTSGNGYVAWLEFAPGKPGRRTLVVLQPNGQRRAVTLLGNVRIRLDREVDLHSGREVTRVVVTRTVQPGGREITSYRSPVSLRVLRTKWRANAADSATDAGITVNATSTLEPVVVDPAAPTTPANAQLPPSRCTFSSTGPAIPDLPDCTDVRVGLQGTLLTAASTVPSGSMPPLDKGYVTTNALDVLDTGTPRWRRIATSRRDYDATTGLLAWCSSKRGIALVEGELRHLDDRPVAPWTLRWVPADPDAAGWTVDGPKLRGFLRDGAEPSLACSGSKIYAKYLRADEDGSTSTRTVRWDVSR